MMIATHRTTPRVKSGIPRQTPPGGVAAPGPAACAQDRVTLSTGTGAPERALPVYPSVSILRRAGGALRMGLEAGLTAAVPLFGLWAERVDSENLEVSGVPDAVRGAALLGALAGTVASVMTHDPVYCLVGMGAHVTASATHGAMLGYQSAS